MRNRFIKLIDTIICMGKLFTFFSSFSLRENVVLIRSVLTQFTASFILNVKAKEESNNHTDLIKTLQLFDGSCHLTGMSSF